MPAPRFHGWRTQLPLIVVLLSFVLLILVPVVIHRNTSAASKALREEVRPAGALVSELQQQLALEAAATRGYVYSGEARYIGAHQRARALRVQAYNELLPLATRFGPKFERDIRQMGRILHEADELLDAFYTGRLSRAEYMRYFPLQQRRFEDVVALTVLAQQEIDRVVSRYQARIIALERAGATLTVLLTVVAVIAALLVAQLSDRYRKLARDFEARAQRQQALREIGSQLSSLLSTQEVIRQVAESAVRMTPAFGAYVERTENGPGTEVEVVAVSGAGTPALGTRIPYPGSLSEAIIESGEAEIVSEVGAIGERMAPYLESSCNHCSGMIVALSSDERVLGALVLLRGQNEPHFTRDEANFIHVLADLASAALRRVMLLETIRESEARYSTILEHLHEIVWLSSPDYSTFYYLSPAYERIFGRSREEFLNSPVTYFDSVHPEDREWVRRVRLDNGASELEYRIIRPDGEVRWIWSRIYPIRNERGEVFRLVGIGEDVTQRKLAEAERERRLALERRTHAEIVTVLESITDAFYALDRDLRFVYVNQGAERLLNRKREELIGQSVWDMFPDLRGTKVERAYRYVLQTRRSAHMELYYAPIDKWLEGRLYPSETGVSVFFQDVTERIHAAEERQKLLRREQQARREAEERRAELDRVQESRSRLMRGFSHDLKNPLGAADGYLQLLEEGIVDSLTESQRKSVLRVRGSIRTALNLIDDLLALERAEAGELEIDHELVDVPRVVRDAVEEYRAKAQAKGLQLELSCERELPAVQSDPARIKQVVTNLLSNAVKYTEHGRVHVRIDERAGADSPAPGRWLTVDVIDTGPGIPGDQQKLLFQEFRRLKSAKKHPGAGLGLAMSRSVARALHGAITLESRPGVGSTFTLWIPLDPQAGHAGEKRHAAD